MIWPLFYNALFLPVFRLALGLLFLINSKVRRGFRGRRDLFRKAEEFMRTHGGKTRIWVHASSMGEFEQAKPIIETLKERHPDTVVIASFFSPSGYENNQHYAYADLITYIPLDSRKNAERFVATIKPSVAALIRYDLWPNHLWACRKQGVPIVLTNATLRARSLRLAPGLRSFHRSVFNTMDAILTVSEDDATTFRRLWLSRPTVEAVGDTRFDRVARKAAGAKSRSPLPASVAEGKRVIVFGSTWSEDEEVFLPVLRKLIARHEDILFVIVPHEPSIQHLEALEFKIGRDIPTIRFSYIAKYGGERIILVDSVGILLSLYASAQIAFVGGGFKFNVHNTLEPAAYGIPVIYGPKIDNSQEARQLIDAGGGFCARNRRDLYKVFLNLLLHDDARQGAGGKAGAFVHDRSGATEVIMGRLGRYLIASDE